MVYKKHIANSNLLKLRRAIGLTQSEFSSEVKIKRCTWGAIEEKRASVKPQIILHCINMGYLSKEQIFDFMFNEGFRPRPTVRYKKRLVSVLRKEFV